MKPHNTIGVIGGNPLSTYVLAKTIIIGDVYRSSFVQDLLKTDKGKQLLDGLVIVEDTYSPPKFPFDHFQIEPHILNKRKNLKRKKVSYNKIKRIINQYI